jgi:hypothetical protein
MSVFPSKDPDAVLDYVYRIALDPGDAVTNHTFVKLTGTVTVDSESIAAAPDTTSDGYGQDVTVRLSGGADGETSVFQAGWTTSGGREDDDIITLFVSSHEYVALALTGYAKPLPAHLKQRYPAFSAVDSGSVQYWLTDAERYVDTSWSEGDYAAALMALAAHNMALAGLGTTAASIPGVPAGVKSFRSGSLSVDMTESAANAIATGSFAATRYGQEYQLLLRRNHGGPLVSDTGVLPTPDYPPFVNGWW